MKRITDALGIITFLAILASLAYAIFFHFPQQRREDRQYWESMTFKTDTVVIKTQYPNIILPKYPNYVPPKFVLNYLDSSVNYIQVHASDSLLRVIDSLQNKITQINIDFIKKYPEASKLLYAEFSTDSLRLDLLNIRGQVNTQLYSLNFERYRYQYRDGEIRAEKLPFKKYKFSSYIYGGYDFAQTTPIIGLDYSVFRDRYRLSGFSNFYIAEKPQLTAGATFGYKLR